MKSLILVLAATLSLNVFASQPFTATCEAYGNRVGGNDGGPFVSDSKLDVIIWGSMGGVMTVTINGDVRVANAYSDAKRPEDLKADNAYIGEFSLEKIKSNPDYNPRKYIGYTQFENVDAIETLGMESGMWGEFVMAPDYAIAPSFHAAYIFQAGDHMGGTLHFTCKVK